MWSKWQRRVAALACGLLLLNVSAPTWAASKKLAHKAAASRAAKKPARGVSRPALPAAEFGPADLLDDDARGLHGQASFYGKGFHGRKTSTGERYNGQQFTAASNRFPLGSLLAVRRVDNERCAIVKVNDRMHPKHRQRIIDVSRGVAEYLDMIRAGVVMVRVVPLRGGAAGDTESCTAAFETPSESISSGQRPKLPDFLLDKGG